MLAVRSAALPMSLCHIDGSVRPELSSGPRPTLRSASPASTSHRGWRATSTGTVVSHGAADLERHHLVRVERHFSAPVGPDRVDRQARRAGCPLPALRTRSADRVGTFSAAIVGEVPMAATTIQDRRFLDGPTVLQPDVSGGRELSAGATGSSGIQERLRGCPARPSTAWYRARKSDIARRTAGAPALARRSRLICVRDALSRVGR
jgi:hypothetical protein